MSRYDLWDTIEAMYTTPGGMRGGFGPPPPPTATVLVDLPGSASQWFRYEAGTLDAARAAAQAAAEAYHARQIAAHPHWKGEIRLISALEWVRIKTPEGRTLHRLTPESVDTTGNYGPGAWA